jgi:hypothetical protein
VEEGDTDDKPHQIFASEALGIKVNVDEHGTVQSTGKYEVVSAVSQSHHDVGCDKGAVQEPLATPLQYGPDTTRKTHMDALLDQALNESFPASDPIAISVPRPRARSDNK